MHSRSLALSLLTALTLAGCGSGSSGGGSTTAGSSTPPPATSSAAAPSSSASGTGTKVEGVGTVAKDDALAAKLPAGTSKITVATNAPYQPFIDFAQTGVTDKFKGLDYDLLQAIGGKLGVPVTVTQQPFDGLVPGLQAGKYDAIVGGITDNKKREQAATWVDYTASGTGIMVKKGDGSIKALADLCGKQVAVQKAAKQVELLKTFSGSSCNGKSIKVTEYPQNTDAQLALLSGKASAFVATKVNLVEAAAKDAGKVEVVNDPAAPNGYQASPNGIGVLRSKGQLAQAMQAALQSLMDDGTYQKILATWKQEAIGIPKATLDGAID